MAKKRPTAIGDYADGCGMSKEIFATVLKSLHEAVRVDGSNRFFFPNGINLIDIDVNIGGAHVSIKVSGGTTFDQTRQALKTFEKQFAPSQWTSDEIKKAAENIFNQTTPGTNCASPNTIPQQDCNCYIKNAVRQFVANLPFDKPGFDADQIIGNLMGTGSQWKALQKNPDEAMLRASRGEVVIAGMNSDDLSEDQGHLALVVEGNEASGTWGRNFPLCCAGSLNPGARVCDRGVQFTFPVKKALDISYFACKPDRTPDLSLLAVAPKQKPGPEPGQAGTDPQLHSLTNAHQSSFPAMSGA